MLCGSLAAVEHCGYIKVHYLLERFGVVLRQWLASGYSGVVYQDIKLAESGSDLIYCVFHC